MQVFPKYEAHSAESDSSSSRGGGRRKLRMFGIVALSLAGLTGAVEAIQSYLRQDVPRLPQEQRLIVQLNAPYGSVAVKPGTTSANIAVIETDGDADDGMSAHFLHSIRNQNLGILKMSIGTDEGALEEPAIAMWRANSGFSLARGGDVVSDGGNSGSESGGNRLTNQITPYTLPPLPHNRGVIYVHAISSDAGTLVTEAVPNSSTTRIYLTRELPMNLHADLGFGPSSMELGGLSINYLNVETGASNATISVSQPNAQQMSLCQVNAGLGECTFSGISNLNAQKFNFQGGVGSYRLGFEGKLTRNLDAWVSVGLGKCAITIPPEAGRVQVFYDDGLLSSYNFSGLTKRRDGYATSVGFDHGNAPVLTLHLSSGLGRMYVSYH